MASRKGVHISGHYMVSINAMPFHTCTLNSKKMEDRTESYLIMFTNSTTIRHGVSFSGYVDFIPTAVSSNRLEKIKSKTTTLLKPLLMLLKK